MSLLGETFVKVGLDTSDFNDGLGAVESGLASILGPIGLAVGAVVGLAESFSFIKGVVSDALGNFAEGEQHFVELASALKHTGQEVDINLGKFEELAQTLMTIANISDDDTFAMIRKGLNLGVPAEQMEQLVKGAVGLSGAIKDISKEDAMKQLAKEMLGVKSNLDRQIPSLVDVTSQTERLAIISEIATSGMAQQSDATATLGGTWESLQLVMGEVSEALGSLFAPAAKLIVEVMRDLAVVALDVMTRMNSLGESFPALSALVSTYWEGFKSSVEGVIDAISRFDEYWLAFNTAVIGDLNTQTAFWAGLEATVVAYVTTCITMLEKLGATVKELRMGLIALVKGASPAAGQALEVADWVGTKTGEGMNSPEVKALQEANKKRKEEQEARRQKVSLPVTKEKTKANEDDDKEWKKKVAAEELINKNNEEAMMESIQKEFQEKERLRKKAEAEAAREAKKQAEKEAKDMSDFLEGKGKYKPDYKDPKKKKEETNSFGSLGDAFFKANENAQKVIAENTKRTNELLEQLVKKKTPVSGLA